MTKTMEKAIELLQLLKWQMEEPPDQDKRINTLSEAVELLLAEYVNDKVSSTDFMSRSNK